MELKFKNITRYNKKIYAEFIQFHTQKNLIKNVIYIFIIIIPLTYIFIYNVKINNMNSVYALLVIIILVILYKVFSQKRIIKREINSSKIKEEKEYEFNFYDEYIIIKNKGREEKMKYKDIYKIWETDKYFYLYVNKTDALILEKLGFAYGTPEEFKKFISTKCILRKYKV